MHRRAEQQTTTISGVGVVTVFTFMQLGLDRGRLVVMCAHAPPSVCVQKLMQQRQQKQRRTGKSEIESESQGRVVKLHSLA